MLPSEVTVLGHVFKVVPMENPSDDDYGEMKGEESRIGINISHSLEDQRKTLFHECIHAAFYVSGWSQVLSHNKEEAIVRLIENALWPLINSAFLSGQNGQ